MPDHWKFVSEEAETVCLHNLEDLEIYDHDWNRQTGS